jgi:hypothetical protein
MTPLQQALTLRRAAALIQSSGLRRNGWGGDGAAVCLNTALALALGLDSARLGRFGFHAIRPNPVTRRVGELIIATGLLDRLPVPQAPSWGVRRPRPASCSPARAVAELARWNDVPGRTAELASGVLLAQASLLEKRAFDVFRETAVVSAPWLESRAAASAIERIQTKAAPSSRA